MRLIKARKKRKIGICANCCAVRTTHTELVWLGEDQWRLVFLCKSCCLEIPVLKRKPKGANVTDDRAKNHS